MDKREFIFPGVVLGLVVVTALGLLLTRDTSTPQIGNSDISTTSMLSAGTTTLVMGQNANSSTAPRTTPTTPTHYYPYGTVILAPDQPAMFKDGVSIRVVGIAEDSRCPTDVQCIQAGTVTLLLKVDTHTKSATHTLSLGKSATYGNDVLTFISITPSRTSTSELNSKDYRFTFSVTPAK